ncbi:hypothetical protein HPT25_20300 [Bacillus sp. BRMEA1]|uniref:hypothetical protein n=1 Tax=Neobacillus endophyticus TaxID=2738405 RepID=UPI001564F564|nr:hypothetical protein [Neobacillus endophyticus]NRD79706.1 hypothetical protein [Neobacillus endophyticus]
MKMDQEFTDNSFIVKKLTKEMKLLQQQLDLLQKELASIQQQCRHIFWETSGFRKCRKCGLTESTYF